MKIVIVGGGTAGWLAAYFINKCFPNIYNISIVESSKLGIIGAGEGSTGTMVDLLNGYWFDYKVDINNFLKKTNGTKKFGIKHINWSKNKKTYFAPLDTSPTGFDLDDYFLKYILYKNKNLNTHLSSTIGIKYQNRIFNDTNAFHFDGNKVGEFFKNICVSEHNNVVIDSIVKNIKLNNNGHVEYIQLDNGQNVCADLFIDCTGFSRIISNSVKTKWISYKNILPLNTAMPFIMKNDSQIDPVTKAHALSSGWMWEIPLQTRKGMGYVFDKNFISVDDAKAEIERYLKKEIEPIKIINFDSGHVDKFWNKNVINFGLSSSFVEPLEATSIHNTIIQIAIFVKEFLTNNKENLFKKENEIKYNQRITKLNQLTIDFISIHYQGGRDDSKFWKYIKEENIISDGAKEYVEFCKYKVPGFINLEGMFGSFSIPLANWIGSGIELLNPEIAKKSLIDSNLLEYAELRYNKFYKNVINEKKYLTYS